MVIAYLGLGSNRGDRAGNIKNALKLVKKLPGTSIKAVSSLYLTSPVGPSQRDFVNSSAKINTKLDPLELLELLKLAEEKIGRTSSPKWGPREIDIDLLFYGKEIIRLPELTVPHKEAHKRLFVLESLKELDPGLIFPATGETVACLARRIKVTHPDQKVRVLRKVTSR